MGTAYWIKGNRTSPHKKDVRPGQNIHDLVMDFNPDTGDWRFPTVCLVDNAPILRKDWKSYRIPENAVVSFVEMPLGGGGGGGSNPLQIIMTVVVAVLSIYTAGIVGAAYGAMYGALAGAAVSAAGGLLMGAIFKPSALPSGQSATPEQGDPTYSISGGNRARLYEVIGEGFGRMRVVPDQVAQPWSYYSGNEQFYYAVVGIGRGSYEVESIAFDNTPFWRKGGGMVSGYEVQVQFCEPGEAVTLFPDNVDTSVEVAGQEIFNPNHPEYNGALGSFPMSSPGTKSSRSVFNIVFPQGGGLYNDRGELTEREMKIRIDYQKIDDLGLPVGGWMTLREISWKLRTMTPQRFSVDASYPEGRYQARITRLDDAVLKGDSLSGQYLGRMIWEGLFSFLPGTLSYNQSVIAMRIMATNSVSRQAVSSISVIQTRKLPIFDPLTKSWSEPAPTRKFAAAISHVLRTSWGGNLADKLIDLDGLWGGIDRMLTEKDWTFDGYFTQAYTVWPLICEMCHPFRVVPRIVGGVVTFVYDRPGRPVRHIFTAHDIIRGSLAITYNTHSEATPTNILWSYLDEAAGFQSREVNCVLPDSETRAPAIKSPIGIVKRDQAHKMGIFQASVNRKRRIMAKFQVEGIGRIFNRGDVCAIHHPYFTRFAAGTVAWWDENALMLDLGAAVEHEGAVYLTLTRPDGSPWGPVLLDHIEGMEAYFDAADYARLLAGGMESPFDWVDFGQGRAPTVWTLNSSAEFGKRMIITGNSPVDSWHFEITCVNDDDTVDEFQNMPTPIWDSRGQINANFKPLAAPAGIGVSPVGNIESPSLFISWLMVAGAANYKVELSIGAGEWCQVAVVPQNEAAITVAPGDVNIRIAAMDIDGKAGPYGRWSGNTDDVFIAAPIFNGAMSAGNTSLTWAAPESAVGSQEAAAWTLRIFKGGGFSEVKRIEFPPGILEFAYTKEMAESDGVLAREVNFSLEYKTVRGNFSNDAALEVTEPAPVLVDISIEIGKTQIIITSATVTGEYNGFIILRGENAKFTISEAVDAIVLDSLPYTLAELAENTTYYFRAAAKDDHYDAAKDKSSLNWSGVTQITTLAEAAPEVMNANSTE